MAKQWFYQEPDGSECGPYSGDEMRKLVRLGRVGRETLVRTDTSKGSIAAGQIKGLFPETDADWAGPTPAAGQRDRTWGYPNEHDYTLRQRPTSNNAFAVASLISGVLGWTIVPVVGAAVAVITGHIALKQIERSDGREDGKIMAVIGLILGYIEAVLLFVAAITLLFLGLSIAGFLSAVFQQAERQLPQQGVGVPRAQRHGVAGPLNPSDLSVWDEALKHAKNLDRQAPRLGVGEARNMRSEDANALVGSWDVSDSKKSKNYIIMFKSSGAVTVRHEFGESTVSPWSYSGNAIMFGGLVQINEISVGGTWKTDWKNDDEIDVITADSNRMTLRRHKRD